MNVRSIFIAHRSKFVLTLFLILLEAGLSTLFPLFIGAAIDGAINSSYRGALSLGILGISVLIVGVGRRVLDSRFYARVYQQIGSQAISRIKDSSASVKSARLSMISELVEFLENALPELIGTIIGLVGVIALIATLNIYVFTGSLIITLIIFIIYRMSSKRTVTLNKQANDELEKQVDVLAGKDETELKSHLQRMTTWNIKLSDLEAANFSFSWIALIGFLVLSVIISVSDGVVQYGALFSLIMYVFQYMENVLNLPLFYQNWLRLQEIKERLEQI